MKDYLEQVRKIDKKRQKLHALECATGCTSWICNNWTTGLTTGMPSLSIQVVYYDKLARFNQLLQVR